MYDGNTNSSLLFNSRATLKLCALASELLEREIPYAEWYIIWLGSISLLRSVGSVLDKVDCKGNSELRSIQNRRFKEWQTNPIQHGIFTDFINAERNLLLKEGRTLTSRDECISLLVEDGETGASQLFHLGSDIYRPLVEGLFENEDCRDVYSDAVNWWKIQLDLIEAEYLAKYIKS